MNSTRPLVIAVGLILGGQLAFAQDMSGYRAYVLESSLDAVVLTSGARVADAKTLHERPATIQELEWRAPYGDSRNTQADPVREITFSYAPEFQLILVSKSLSARARTAVREAVRLDAIEAPRREAAQRKKKAGEAGAARAKTRIANKAAFRP
jgi:hypothetical protein